MLEFMGLIQHVNVPTHEHVHVLDPVITRQCDSIILQEPKIGHFFSDCAVVHCSLNSFKPGASVQSITYRKLKTIDLDALRGELAKSRLFTEEIDNLDELVSCYSSTLSSLMDKHAPLQFRNVVNRPRIPWFNDIIRDAIKASRKAERKWRRTKSVSHLADFKQKKNYATLLMNRTRCTYYSEFINENSVDQERLFRATKTLLKDSNKLSLPEGSDAQVLANNMSTFFVEKVNNIQAKLTGEVASNTSLELEFIKNSNSGAPFLDFNELSSDDVMTMMMQSSKKSCTLDIMPYLMPYHLFPS